MGRAEKGEGRGSLFTGLGDFSGFFEVQNVSVRYKIFQDI